MDDYYNRKGQPIGREENYKLWGDLSYKILKQEYVGDVWISTVWLGMNHNYSGLVGSAPLIFETMVFNRKEGQEDLGGEIECERYSTEEQAFAGHEKMKLKYLPTPPSV